MHTKGKNKHMLLYGGGDACDLPERTKNTEADSLCFERTERRNPFFAAENLLTLPSLRKTFAHCQMQEPAGKPHSALDWASERLMSQDCGYRQLKFQHFSLETGPVGASFRDS